MFLITGHIKWEEFHVHFLLAKGHDLKKAEQHVVDYETIPLDPDGEWPKKMVGWVSDIRESYVDVKVTFISYVMLLRLDHFNHVFFCY